MVSSTEYTRRRAVQPAIWRTFFLSRRRPVGGGENDLRLPRDGDRSVSLRIADQFLAEKIFRRYVSDAVSSLGEDGEASAD